jgi:hypothetical protein
MMRRVVRKVVRFDPANYKAGKFKTLDDYAQQMLIQADAIFEWSADLDTAVRDTVCTGLAYLVHSAFDSQASSLCLQGPAFSSFIDNATAEWFRERDFAEWFCVGAGNLFHSSRPRSLAEMREVIKFRRSPGKKKRGAA